MKNNIIRRKRKVLIPRQRSYVLSKMAIVDECGCVALSSSIRRIFHFCVIIHNIHTNIFVYTTKKCNDYYQNSKKKKCINTQPDLRISKYYSITK